LALSPDGTTLALAMETERRVALVRASDGQFLRSLPTASETTAVVFMPDGTGLITGERGSRPNATVRLRGELRRWNIDENGSKPTWRVPVSGGVRSLAIAPDGRRLVIGSVYGDVSLHDPTSGTRLVGFNESGNGVNSVCFARRGASLFIAGQYLHGWDAEALLAASPAPTSITGDSTPKDAKGLLRKPQGWAFSLAAAPDGARVAALTAVPALGQVTRLKILLAENAELEKTLGDDLDRPTCTVWSPDGKRLAVGDEGGRVRFLQLRDGTEIPGFTADVGPIRAMIWLADDRLALAGIDGARAEIRLVSDPSKSTPLKTR
jgi:WD40 repeat protein